MATVIPVTGSFTEYAERFIDDSLAFALGWAYWYLWVTVRICLFCITGIVWLTALGPGKRIHLHFPRDRLLDPGRAPMGMDAYLLGSILGHF